MFKFYTFLYQKELSINNEIKFNCKMKCLSENLYCEKNVLGTISKLIDAKKDEQCSSGGGEGVRIIKVLYSSYKSFLASKVRKTLKNPCQSDAKVRSLLVF